MQALPWPPIGFVCRMVQATLACSDLGIIPQYNVGGASRRNCCTRANQDGPEAYGFRGNAQNLDLNRDFVKMDSRNAFTFVETFHAVNPDVFIDTHTSNGADYPYTMTLIETQPDKAGPVLGPFIRRHVDACVERSHGRTRGCRWFPTCIAEERRPTTGSWASSRRLATAQGMLPCGTLGFTTEAHAQALSGPRESDTAFFGEHGAWLQDHGGTCLMRGNASANAWRRQNPCLSDGPWIL